MALLGQCNFCKKIMFLLDTKIVDPETDLTYCTVYCCNEHRKTK